MKQLILSTLLSSALLIAAISAYANHHEGAEQESEQYEMKADANGDGKVSYDEFKAAREKHMQEHFNRRDTNSDGFIDEAERKTAKEGWKKHGRKDGEKCEKHQH
jgi:Ca2+-binding EF-hand superfamily protein